MYAEEMEDRMIRTNGVQISYQLPRGAWMTKMYRPGNPDILTEVTRLRKRRIDAAVKVRGVEIGAVWKLGGRWTWYLDYQAAGLE